LLDPRSPRSADNFQGIRKTLLNLGGRAGIAEVLTATAVLDYASIAAQTCGEKTVTVTGAAVGDSVKIGPPAALEAGLSVTGIVTAANTVTIRLCNVTSGAIDPASATYRVTVDHH